MNLEPHEVLQHPDRLIAFLYAFEQAPDPSIVSSTEGLPSLLDAATEANLTTLPSIPFDTKTKKHNGSLEASRIYDAAYALTGMTSNARRAVSSLAEAQAEELVERVADRMARDTAEAEQRGSDGV